MRFFYKNITNLVVFLLVLTMTACNDINNGYSGVGQGSNLNSINVLTASSESAVAAKQYAYILDGDANAVYMYRINSNGRLSSLASRESVATGNNPWGITVDPTAHFVYIPNYDGDGAHPNGSISQYS